MSQINVDNIRNRLGGAIGAPSGIVVTGVSTFSGDVSIGGTLTYEDVTNVDSVGVITARSGVRIGATGANTLIAGNATGIGIGTDSPATKLHIEGSGTQTLRIEESGSNVIGKLFATTSKIGISAQSNHPLSLEVNNDEKARIDTSGRALFGTSTSPTAGNGQYANIVVQGYPSTPQGAGHISLQRGQAAFGADNQIGLINFGDNTGASYAGIECYADADSGSSDYPGRLVLSTTADSASSPTERMRLDSSGRLLKSGQATLTSTSLSHPIQVAAASDSNAIAIIGKAADDIGELSYYEADKSTKLGEIQYRQDHANIRHRVGDLRFATGGTTERLRITSDGKFGFKTTTPNYTVDINGEVGVTEGQPITWHDGSGNASAQIFAQSDDSLVFRTTSAGAERMRILSGGGLTFNGDTAQANALDDYEEGTWSPSIGGSATYDIQWGYYIKIGKSVQCWGGLRPNSMGSGNAKQIQNLPFTSLNTPGTTMSGGGAIVWHDNCPSSITNTPAITNHPNSTSCNINAKTAASTSLGDNVNFWQNNHRANFFITYQTA